MYCANWDKTLLYSESSGVFSLKSILSSISSIYLSWLPSPRFKHGWTLEKKFLNYLHWQLVSINSGECGDGLSNGLICESFQMLVSMKTLL